jgi:hypothetical protein
VALICSSLSLPYCQALLLETGLEKTAAAAAAVVVGAVGLHVDEVFFPHDGFDHEAQVLGNGIAEDLRTIWQGSWTVNLIFRSLFQSELTLSLPSRIHLA